MKKHLLHIALVLAVLLMLSGCAAGADPAAQSSDVTGQSGLNPTTEAEEIQMQQTTLSFHSFDGGGPSFHAILDDESIVSVKEEIEYGNPKHDEIDGAAFTVTFTFTGRKPGTTGLLIEERSPIAGNYDHSYTVTVGEDLRVTVEELPVTDLDLSSELIRPLPTLVIAVGNRVFYAVPEDNPTAEALTELLSREPIEMELNESDGLEKMGELPWDLPQDDETITAQPGDVLLFRGNQLAVCCGETSRDCTRIARIYDVDRETLLEVFGFGSVTVTLWIEWSE